MESQFRRVSGPPGRPPGEAGLTRGLLLGGGLFALLLLISQAIFIVPAGTVAVITTLGKVTDPPRTAGPNLKLPLLQQAYSFDIKTQVVPEKFASLTKDLQVIEATATLKYALKPDKAGDIFAEIANDNRQIYPRIVQPSLLKALKAVFSQNELVTIASEWGSISDRVEARVADELKRYGYVDVQGLDLTGLVIAEEYRSAIEEKQIAEQRLLKAETEVRIAEEEAKRFQTLSESLSGEVLYKLFLDKWDGKTSVVPGLPGGSPVPVIVNGGR
ncbi:MAG: prohibitin family protein [Aphanocapsa feldmannii 277cV]|uniref:Prohibitin family protein n=2 Tax=Aphanocapsa feldmannii TaxID=192050 RepID=A0A524RPX2_9CHRO|nr:MAG: prohibitin family protein [Aphanocapsa feldmannii 277cV]TGH18924.1 MAG: prohibitin family protein [Aphanocapsa feldmannii 277cI]